MLTMRALGFRHSALFLNQSASKTTVVENRGEMSDLFSSVKVRKVMGEIPHFYIIRDEEPS